MSTIFWAVLLANITSYAVVDAIRDLNDFYKRKKRHKELQAFLDELEDYEADDEDEDE